MSGKQLSRRELLRLAGASAVAALAAGCGGTPEPTATARVVEKIVEKPVEKIVEKPVTQIVEKQVTQVVEKVVEKLVTPTALPPTPTPAPVTINYAIYSEGADMPVLNRYISGFQSKYPSITVKLEVTPWGQYWTKLQTQVAAGTGPDTFEMSGWYLREFADKAVIQDLTPFMDQAKKAGLPESDYYWKMQTGGAYKGKTWAFAPGGGAIALVYNKDMFDAAKVAYPTKTWTWDDMLTNARKLTFDANGKHPDEAGFDAKNIKQWGVYYRPQTTTMDLMMNTYYNDGGVLNADGTKCALTEANSTAAVQWFYDLYAKHHVAPGLENFTGDDIPFAAKKVAMASAGGWILPNYLDNKELKWAVVPLPLPAGKPRKWASGGGGGGFSINSKTKFPQQAWQFAAYVCTDESVQTALAIRKTGVPFNKKIAELYLVPPPEGIETYRNDLEFPLTSLGGTSRNMSKWATALREEIEAIWLGKKAVQQGLADASKRIDEFLAG